MRIPALARIAGVALVASSLAACMDMELTIEPLTVDTGRSTTTQTLDRSIYDAFIAPDPQSATSFCSDGEATVGDTVVTCYAATEGPYADLAGDPTDPTSLQITYIGNNQVRVEAPTSGLSDDMQASVGGEEGVPPEQMAMILSLFEGKYLTLRVIGTIVETNGEIAEDGHSAFLAIPFADLLQGTAVLPDSFYAIVQLP